ncbi:WD40-repeat-containing domain protein [Phlebopus sp. FC_14]|nr:WD40-repeat-containing domain protein [Phlebopus sp. FC_14]
MDVENSCYSHYRTLVIPAPVSCLTFAEPTWLLAGSDDGCVRVYDMTTLKVTKAIRGLDAVSSVVWRSNGCLWVGSGRRVMAFTLETDKLVLTAADAVTNLEIGANADDVLNELSINGKGTQLAFCSDLGTVGVLDLQTNRITQMRQSHGNICGTVRFIPDRPSELVSGGYDSTILHFDFSRGGVVSRDDLRGAPPTSSVSMSPPFVLSMSMSSKGLIAAGTADGRLYVGTGGEKPVTDSVGRQKRRRKWDGLRSKGKIIATVAQGPVVALVFTGPREILTCTLSGRIQYHKICGTATNNDLSVVSEWAQETKDSFKVNAMAASVNSIIIGGFQKEGRGVIEIWTRIDADGVNAHESK